MTGRFKALPMDDSDGLVTYMLNHTHRVKASEIWVTPSRVALPSCYLKDAEKIYNMDVRPDDTWVITFPKCGKYYFLNGISESISFTLKKKLLLIGLN